ncbi:MAG: hypothetical protein Q9174_003080 [Haloplaca sp. 1 TL-2023]
MDHTLPAYVLSYPANIVNGRRELRSTDSIQRGGAGNIDSPRVKATRNEGQTGDGDVIPETALRQAGAHHENYHIGRGGEGNVHREHEEKSGQNESLGDKLKQKIMGKKE